MQTIPQSDVQKFLLSYSQGIGSHHKISELCSKYDAYIYLATLYSQLCPENLFDSKRVRVEPTKKKSLPKSIDTKVVKKGYKYCVGTKRNPGCVKLKTISNFRTTPSGFRNTCKECEKKANFNRIQHFTFKTSALEPKSQYPTYLEMLLWTLQISNRYELNPQVFTHHRKDAPILNPSTGIHNHPLQFSSMFMPSPSTDSLSTPSTLQDLIDKNYFTIEENPLHDLQ